jgi:hypothetical protein
LRGGGETSKCYDAQYCIVTVAQMNLQ